MRAYGSHSVYYNWYRSSPGAFALSVLVKVSGAAYARDAAIHTSFYPPSPRDAKTPPVSSFRIDNTDHIIDVNKGNVQFEYDQVDIICPVYMPGTFDEDAEKYIIYNVSKEEYETCRITNPNPRIIAICDKPYKLMYFTITFRPFTPQPGGLEFLPGKDYYFICESPPIPLKPRNY